MQDKLVLLVPVAESVETVAASMAPRLDTLRGKTALLLDNRKTNAYELLQKVGALLRSEYGVGEIISIRKQPDYSRAVTLDELGENIGKAHLAVTALGD